MFDALGLGKNMIGYNKWHKADFYFIRSASISLAVLANGFPNNLLPFSVMTKSSSILIPFIFL